MLADNETGVIQDVAAHARAVRAAGGWMHCDAVQALGKVKVDFRALGVQGLTLSATRFTARWAWALVIDFQNVWSSRRWWPGAARSATCVPAPKT